jgi:hypothetical protein
MSPSRSHVDPNPGQTALGATPSSVTPVSPDAPDTILPAGIPSGIVNAAWPAWLPRIRRS